MRTGNRTSRPQTGGSASIVAYAVLCCRLRSRRTGCPLASCVGVAGSGAADDVRDGRRSRSGKREDDVSGCVGMVDGRMAGSRKVGKDADAERYR